MSKEVVIVLHGLGRSALAMLRVQHHLRNHYTVVNQSYPSQKHPIARLAEMAIRPAVEAHADAPAIHFVTHSMGGILVRQYLEANDIPNLGRTVMLGPPNGGSELVDFFRKLKLYRMLNGPAGQQLGTEAASVPNSLGAVQFPVGVIAGDRSLSPLYSKLIEGDDDGKVSVARSKVEGMVDHLVMPVSHTFMMLSKDVLDQVAYFL